MHCGKTWTFKKNSGIIYWTTRGSLSKMKAGWGGCTLCPLCSTAIKWLSSDYSFCHWLKYSLADGSVCLNAIIVEFFFFAVCVILMHSCCWNDNFEHYCSQFNYQPSLFSISKDTLGSRCCWRKLYHTKNPKKKHFTFTPSNMKPWSVLS